ncbi:MAG: radical SAM/SPASM domain-containing protein [Patescibacteria group bacterium]
MNEKEVRKEVNKFIFKYQKEDVNEKLTSILGNDFKKYREDFNKTQNYLKTKFIPDFPITISLELINRCNLNCIMCYKKHHTEPRAMLGLEIIKKIMDECREHKMPSMILGLGSETLMYNKVKGVIKKTREAGIQDVFFGTNGVMLSEDIIKSVIKNKISRVEISIDAATAETYNRVRRVPVFEKVEENINKLVELKRKFNTPLPVIRLCFVVMDINEHETGQFIKKWKNKVDYIDFQRFIDFSQVGKPVPPGKIEKEVIKNSFCSYPFYSLNIWANGDISPCCTYYGKELVIGNIHRDKLKEIWNGEKIKKIREQISLKKFNPVCQKCLYFRDKNLIDSSF